jgi:superfamily II DNA/RNA helicase
VKVPARRFVALQGMSSAQQLPSTLEEFQVVTAASDKPHALIALLVQLLQPPGMADPASLQSGSSEAPVAQVLVFAASVEVTHRLTVMLAACEDELGAPVQEISSRLSTREQQDVLDRFRDGHTR